MTLIKEEEMAKTRLELRWTRQEDDNNTTWGLQQVWLCEYSLILGLRYADIRAEGEDGTLGVKKEKKFELGGTKVIGGCGKLDLARQNIQLPFRYGAHIWWDAEQLNHIPAYVVCEGWAMKLDTTKER